MVHVLEKFENTNQYLNQTYVDYLIKKNPLQNHNETLLQTEECLKFLVLCSLVSGPIPINKKIDEIWHLLILETEAYAELCQRLPGKAFIHHNSKDYSASNVNEVFGVLPESKQQLEWLVSYVANFGPFQSEEVKYWPIAIKIMGILNLNLQQLNEKLQQLSKS